MIGFKMQTDRQRPFMHISGDIGKREIASRLLSKVKSTLHTVTCVLLLILAVLLVINEFDLHQKCLEMTRPECVPTLLKG